DAGGRRSRSCGDDEDAVQRCRWPAVTGAVLRADPNSEGSRTSSRYVDPLVVDAVGGLGDETSAAEGLSSTRTWPPCRVTMERTTATVVDDEGSPGVRVAQARRTRPHRPRRNRARGRRLRRDHGRLDGGDEVRRPG
ncbi:MAG: hypothetical protein ACRDZN_11895, partial [Acidimicrobiales bacterium]